ncbi:MAG TPA: hypothetical protein VK933_01815 [Longimicrobiales bacterium]|nr:hypothetical protein [Longimicrobiales bacterium]
MRHIVPGVAAVLLTPALLSAQVRPPDARAVPAEAREESANVGQACELSGNEGIVLAFGACPAPGGGAAGEVEIIEYRNGDSRMQVARVTVRGVVRGELDATHIGWSDLDDDGDGVPTQVARRAGGRMKVGRVTLRQTQVAGADRAALPWEPGDTDGDGFPVTVELRDPSGGITTVTFEECRAASGSRPAAEGVTLTCRVVRMMAALDANPYARFVARATARPDADISLLDRRTPSSAAPSALAARGAARSTRTFRLEGVRLDTWTVDFDPARDGAGQWTLEVRVNRIEMS